MDFSYVSHYNWRIHHDLSHHHYTNTELDLEAAAGEPFLFYFSNKPHNNISVAIIFMFFALFYSTIDCISHLIACVIGWGHFGPENLIPFVEYGIMYYARG